MGQRTKPFQAPITRRAFLRGGPPRSRGDRLYLPSARGAAGPSARRRRCASTGRQRENSPLSTSAREGVLRGARLDVEISKGKSGTQAVQVVGTGNDTFGFVPSIQVVQGINQGNPIKVTGTFGRVTGCAGHRGRKPPGRTQGPRGTQVSTPRPPLLQVWPAFARKHKLDLAKIEPSTQNPSARNGLFLSRRLDIMADIFVANDFVILESRPSRSSIPPALRPGLRPGRLRPGSSTGGDGARSGSGPAVHAGHAEGLQHMVDAPKEAIAIMTKLYGERLGPEIYEGSGSAAPDARQTGTRVWGLERARVAAVAGPPARGGVIDKKLPCRNTSRTTSSRPE